MRLIHGEIASKDDVILITGNGAVDIRVLTGFVEKYDHSKRLLYPMSGIKTGIQSAIDTLTTLAHKLVNKIYMIIIDREHVESFEQVLSELRSHGFHIKDKRNLADNAFMLDLYLGQKEIKLYISIFGFTKKGRIEENISKLIRIKYGRNIKPSKKEIRSWLRSRKLRDLDLIRMSSKDELNKSFPALTAIIQEISKDC